tara:strand:+ start:347 stop:577 length:231 start_codon:yes stop_codon:yes gene_type:complete
MKNLILILLLSFSFTVNAQKKCVTTTVEKVGDYKVKVIKKNKCGEKTVIKIQTYLKKDWLALQKKRKQRIKKRRNK